MRLFSKEIAKLEEASLFWAPKQTTASFFKNWVSVQSTESDKASRGLAVVPVSTYPGHELRYL